MGTLFGPRLSSSATHRASRAGGGSARAIPPGPRLRPAPAGLELGGVELVVFGGGVLGGAVARVAMAGGAAVTVASRTRREHAGWWRPFTLTEKVVFPSWIPRGAQVVVALGPRPGEGPAAA